MKDKAVDALHAKLKRKGEELNFKYLEDINTSLAQAKEKITAVLPTKWCTTSFNPPSRLNYGSNNM